MAMQRSSLTVRTPAAFTAAVATVLLTGCAGSSTATSESVRASESRAYCIDTFDAGTDYFTEKAAFRHAKGVTVEYHKSYKVVTVKEPQKGAKTPATYVLVQCGAPKPELTGPLANATVVTIPVTRVASTSTTQVPAFDIIDKTDVIAGMGTPHLLWPGKAYDAFKAGRIAAFSNESGQIDVEKVAAIKPDLFITGGMDDAAGKRVAELGIPVVADSEWLENTPLARSEWIKYIALYLNAEKQATTAFDTIANDYQAAAKKAASVARRPTVLLGGGHKGTWYRAQGDSYVARFMEDAGADYVYARTPGNSTDPVDIEQILATGAQAQFWLNRRTSKGWIRIADAIKDDARYGRLAAVKTGQVWNPTKRIGPGGGNDYWQSGVVRPDAVLSDLVAIFHPELEPNHEFTYYEKLPE